MENENKERIVLSDEELMAVTGGKKISNPLVVKAAIDLCRKQTPPPKCIAAPDCAWVNNACLPDPDKYEYKIFN